MADPFQLFQDFCYYRSNTQNIKRLQQTTPMRALKYTDARRDLFLDLIAWCALHNVPPRQWVYTLFKTRRWIFAPKLEEGHLCSEKHIPKFYKVSDYDFYNSYIESQSVVNMSDPNIDIVVATELRKRELVLKGGGILCMEFMDEETFGFHPKSSICVECADKQKCSDILTRKVGFRILELRGKK